MNRLEHDDVAAAQVVVSSPTAAFLIEHRSGLPGAWQHQPNITRCGARRLRGSSWRCIAFLTKLVVCSSVCRLSRESPIHSRMTALRVSCLFISSLLIIVTSHSAMRLNNARNRIQLGKRQLFDVSKRTTRCLAKLHFQLVQKASERRPWFRLCFWCHFRSGSAHIVIFGPIFSDVTVQTRTPEFQHGGT